MCISSVYGSSRYETVESIGCTWSNPCLVKLVYEGSSAAWSRAATLLAQLSQNSHNQKPKSSRWSCGSPSYQPLYGQDHILSFVKADALSPMIQILEANDQALHEALATLM